MPHLPMLLCATEPMVQVQTFERFNGLNLALSITSCSVCSEASPNDRSSSWSKRSKAFQRIPLSKLRPLTVFSRTIPLGPDG